MSASAARFIIGIDLGTTHTVVAYADTREAAKAGVDEPPSIQPFRIPQLIAAGEIGERDMLPSARYQSACGELPDADCVLPWSAQPKTADCHLEPRKERTATGNEVIGTWALTMGSKVPGRLVASAKSWLSHAAVDRTADILPWGATGDVRKISPVEASASYLKHVARAWNLTHPEHPLSQQQVVLTVPASFDEAARALTLEAAQLAGLPRGVRLLEEPQAAFYAWLSRHRNAARVGATRSDFTQLLAEHRLALVVDIGGGTTDLSLIQLELRPSGPRLTRIAVGDHLMLGGDNMDLALALAAEPRLAQGSGAEGKLGSARFAQLLAQCRRAKEKLLGDDAPAQVRISVLGSGSKLIGGARSTPIARAEAERLVLDGFFPHVNADSRPSKRRSALVEFGLPYVADAAITKHIAAFVADHEQLARDALGDAAPATGKLPVPDVILLNGGVFRGGALGRRVLDVLGRWRGAPPRLLQNDAPELAVARGAVAYALARKGVGLRIGGGSARSYYLALGGGESPRTGVCILPRGADEGEEVLLEKRTFSLKLGRPVRFCVMSSAQDVRHHAPGDKVELSGEGFVELPPLAAVLAASDKDKGRDVPVQLITSLTEIGTLELSCVAAHQQTPEEAARERWKLELQLRGKSSDRLAVERVTRLHPRFTEATEAARLVYGKSSQQVHARQVKGLRSELEKLLGPRTKWDTPLLRELFGALWAGAKRRRRSAAHERVWFNLTGYTLRPGFGYPLDEWRVGELWSIFKAGVEFMPESQNHAEWWILWRRVAGGLDAAQHNALMDVIEWYLHPPTPRPRRRPAGPKWLGHDDMTRLAASLEHVDAERKERVGQWLFERLTKHREGPQTWWSLGKLGARVPFYGSAHNVVAKSVAETWLRACMELDWSQLEHAPFAATQLARRSGDRDRDVDPELGERVAMRLADAGMPESWQEMVRDVTHLEAQDASRVFGESLPPGLRLLD